MTKFFDPIAQEYRELNIGRREAATAAPAPPPSPTNGFCSLNGHDFDPNTNNCRRCGINKTAWLTGKNAGKVTP